MTRVLVILALLAGCGTETSFNGRRVIRHSRATTFVPFGAGQFQNQRASKGIALAIVQVATFGVSIGTWSYLVGSYGTNATIPRDMGDDVLALQRIQVGTGIAFLALYALGVVDANLDYEPVLVIEEAR